MVSPNQTCPSELLSTNPQITEMVTLAIIGSISLIGNILVIAVISRSHRVQWVTNLFVAHLAIVNLSVPVLSVPFYFYLSLKGCWVFGDITCKLVHFAHYLNAGVSICMLACIALDRYYVVVHPLTLHLRRSQTFQLITFIWIFIIFISTPMLYFYKSTSHGNTCKVDNKVPSWGGFFIVFSLSAFFAPLCILISLYAIVLQTIFKRDIKAKANIPPVTLQGSIPDGQKTQPRFLGKVPKTKRKVIKMLIIQDIVFVVCWVPFFANEFSKLWPSSSQERNTVYLWMCFSNATINPVLYAIFNSNFRKGCRHLVNVNLAHPYTLKSLQRRHQVGINDSSHRGSEDDGIEKYGITLKQSRHMSLFSTDTNDGRNMTDLRANSNKDEDQKHFVRLFQASSALSVDAWT